MTTTGAITAIAANVGRRAARSPLFLAMTTAVGATLFSFPPVDPADPIGAVRFGAAAVVATLTVVLGAAGLVSAIVRRGAWRDDAAERLRGPRVAAVGEALGLALVLCAAAGAGAIAGVVRLTAGGADPGVQRPEPYFRRVLWSNEIPVRLAPGESLAFTVVPDAAAIGGVVLDLGGRLARAEGRAASRPNGAATAAGEDDALHIRWRTPGRAWREDYLPTVRGRTARMRLPYGDLDALPETVEVRVTAPPARLLRLAPGDAVVLGGRRPASSAMLRAALIAACGALGAAAVYRAFASCLRGALAAPAALTLLLFATAASEVYGPTSFAARAAAYLPGGAPYDAGEALRLGRSVEWGDVGSAGLRSASALLLAAALARRRAEETS